MEPSPDPALDRLERGFAATHSFALDEFQVRANRALAAGRSVLVCAPTGVMTTEVLRNMFYERSPTLDGLRVVVMDEVHYLKDPYRGATWEEIFIHLPAEVQMAALSATLSNAEEFGDWVRSVRGPTDVVIERNRPVPIEHLYMVGPKLHQMFVRDGERLKPNPALRRLNEPEPRARGRRY